MPTDPFVEEIHAIREALSKESGDDMERIVEAARARQRQSGRPGVTLPPKVAEATKKAS